MKRERTAVTSAPNTAGPEHFVALREAHEQRKGHPRTVGWVKERWVKER